jgi:Uma2 family endonuclease
MMDTFCTTQPASNNESAQARGKGTTMASCVVFEELVEIPLDIATLAEFRQWSLSDSFPQTGRIDYLAGRIEVDMSPEELYTHGTPKAKVCSVLQQLVDDHDLGEVFVDRTRVVNTAADLSAEPDFVFVSWQSLQSGKVRPVPKAGDGKEKYMELDGSPDLVVEIVSDSSVAKDTKRLPNLYFRAGVIEYWLIDARKKELQFTIHHRGARKFKPVSVSRDGLQRSAVFDKRFRLERRKNRMNHWRYDLHVFDT